MARDRLGKLPAPAELVSIARLQAGAADPLALLVQTGHRLLVLSDEVVHTCEGVRDDGKPGLGRDVLNPPAVEVDLAAVAQCLEVFGSGTQRHRRFSSARYMRPRRVAGARLRTIAESIGPTPLHVGLSRIIFISIGVRPG